MPRISGDDCAPNFKTSLSAIQYILAFKFRSDSLHYWQYQRIACVLLVVISSIISSDYLIAPIALLNSYKCSLLFQRSKIPVYNRMWEFMTSRKHVFADTYQEGIERVRSSKGKYAFLLESVRNDFTNEQLPCDTLKIGQNLNTNGYGVATPRGSPLK